jgi:hypothetical protein
MVTPSFNIAKHDLVIFYLLLYILFDGCITPYDFKADSKDPIIIITGQISTIEGRSFVSVGRTAETQRLPYPVEGASVTLFNETNTTHAYAEVKPGEYWLDNFVGKPNSTYYIKVVLPNGSIYQSKPEKMPQEVGQVAVDYEFLKEETVDFEGIVTLSPYLKIYANSILPSSNKDNIFLKWSVEEVFAIIPTDCGGFGPPKLTCFIKQSADPQRVPLFNRANTSKLSTGSNVVANRLVDYSFLNKHSFTVYQSSISKEAYNYWAKINILANQVGSIFDTPPAEIKGNISNLNKSEEKVSGFFQASNESFTRFSLFESDVPFPLLVANCICDNRVSVGGAYPTRCLECISVRNSSYLRPSWF